MNGAALRRAVRGLTWADVGILATVLIWGSNMVVVKAALREITPLTFTALRFVGASILETIILYASGENLSIPWRDLRRMIVLSLFGVIAYQALFVLGIARTTAGNTSVLLATIPIFVALYNAGFKHERLERHVGLGAALTFAGIFLLTLGRGQALRAQWHTLFGDLLVILAALGWTVHTVGSRSLLQVYSPIKLTTLSMLLATPALVLLALPEMRTLPWERISPASWAGLAYSGVFSIAVAYLLWNVSVKRLGDTRTAVYSNLTPIISLLAARAFLDERLNGWQFLGALIVLAGVWLARFGPRRRPAQETL